MSLQKNLFKSLEDDCSYYKMNRFYSYFVLINLESIVCLILTKKRNQIRLKIISMTVQFI